MPDTEEYLSPLIRKLILVSYTSHRLVRFSFTFAGIQILKQILSNTRNVRDSVARYQNKYDSVCQSGNQREIEKAKDLKDAIKKANNFLSESSQNLTRLLLLKRSQDCQVFIRKLVLDQVQSHETIFYPELFFTDPDSFQHVLESVFQGIKDESSL